LNDSPGDRLDSWKEIAAYLNRGVRTVRRWEHDEGMPVHRHVHRTLGSVYAFKSEIDAWRQAGSRSPNVLPLPDGAPAIAILPFANLSADPRNAYLADGLSDEITADLAGVRTLRVVSRRSAMRFASTRKDAKAVAAELGVRYLVEGSVRRAGDDLRITAQLIDASLDETIWADKYTGSVSDVFEMQERLARTIVDALALRLTPDEDRRLSTRPLDSIPAYECYLQARQEVWRWRKDSIDHGVRLLRTALEMIGDNAVLHARSGLRICSIARRASI
jgi:TolB-like protein